MPTIFKYYSQNCSNCQMLSVKFKAGSSKYLIDNSLEIKLK